MQCLTPSSLASWYQFTQLGEQGHKNVSSLSNVHSYLSVLKSGDLNWGPLAPKQVFDHTAILPAQIDHHLCEIKIEYKTVGLVETDSNDRLECVTKFCYL